MEILKQQLKEVIADVHLNEPEKVEHIATIIKSEKITSVLTTFLVIALFTTILGGWYLISGHNEKVSIMRYNAAQTDSIAKHYSIRLDSLIYFQDISKNVVK